MIFHIEIIVDHGKIASKTKAHRRIPQMLSFFNKPRENSIEQQMESNKG